MSRFFAFIFALFICGSIHAQTIGGGIINHNHSGSGSGGSPLLLPDGTGCSDVPYSFVNNDLTGFYRYTAGGESIGICINNLDYVRFATAQTVITGSIGWAPTNAHQTVDVILIRDANDTLAMRRSTSPQTFRLYGTFTDASNYERLVLDNQHVWTASAGTGLPRALVVGTQGNAGLFFDTNSTDRWTVQPGGNFVAVTDNTYDIGAAGANRPRDVYIAGNLTVGGSIVGSTGCVTGTETTASGTSVTITGIPTTAKTIYVQMDGIAQSGTTTDIKVQIGPSGGVETTGYVAAANVLPSGSAIVGTAYTDSFGFRTGVNTVALRGVLTLTLMNASNKWAASGSVYNNISVQSILVSGTKALAGALERVKLFTANGTDTLSGTFTVSYCQ